MAIGNKGQNARLAAKLTGWKIDIKPESGFFGEEEEPEQTEEAQESDTPEAVETAEALESQETGKRRNIS